MSVRKRTWKNSKGEKKEAWIVDYRDQQGARRILHSRARRTPTSITRPSK